MPFPEGQNEVDVYLADFSSFSTPQIRSTDKVYLFRGRMEQKQASKGSAELASESEPSSPDESEGIPTSPNDQDIEGPWVWRVSKVSQEKSRLKIPENVSWDVDFDDFGK